MKSFEPHHESERKKVRLGSLIRFDTLGGDVYFGFITRIEQERFDITWSNNFNVSRNCTVKDDFTDGIYTFVY